MRSLIFLLPVFLVLALCACRSSRHSEASSSETSALMADMHRFRADTDDFFSLVTVTREADLFGIRFEFFPPDSAAITDRPALKAVTVDKVQAKSSTESSAISTARSSEEETAAVEAEAHSSTQTAEEHKADALRPPAWLLVAVALAVALVAGTLWLRYASGRI